MLSSVFGWLQFVSKDSKAIGKADKNSIYSHLKSSTFKIQLDQMVVQKKWPKSRLKTATSGG